VQAAHGRIRITEDDVDAILDEVGALKPDVVD
jgi:hypothetical protein